MAYVDAVGEAGIRRIFVGLVSDDDNAPGAFGQNLLRDLRHGERAFDRLAAGHRHYVIVENFVGDVDSRRRRGADRQQAAVRVGTVAEVLKNVIFRGERRLPDPVGALAAHLRGGGGFAAGHEQCHAVAADAGHGAAALGHAGRGVVRTAGAEKGHARDFGRRRRKRALERFEPRQTFVEL